MEFHINKKARDKYEFDHELFSLNGDVLFANFHAARLFAQALNTEKDLANYPELAVQAGQVNALGLIDEILHLIIKLYLGKNGSGLMDNFRDYLASELGEPALRNILLTFNDNFPYVKDYRSKNDLTAGKIKEGDNVYLNNLLEELIVLWLTNQNKATLPYAELFDDSELVRQEAYSLFIIKMNNFFQKQPHFGPDDQDLLTMLRTPSIEVPYSLSGQIEFIRKKWGHLLGSYLYRLLSSLDFIKEEQKLFFNGDISMIPTAPPELSTYGKEYERFSPDSEWMPNVVMLAKNTYVWLTQLSKEYGREIKYLSQIPDETLDQLHSWGFTGLWLIGLWERSTASKEIKQLCGNPDAVASAYSLKRYQIAEDIGGELAYENFKERATQRGIRLASDMVPNHMGIDSDWVYDHPDWFIQSNSSPFPAYSFSGIDLSQNSRISINIEDHYYDRTDAAVVFKLYNHETHQDSFIYHGNDGTSMPWNDTAQLNYLLPRVREAVIKTILEVARKFPIIRFDAAMTLAKKHFQRLWFPQPGTGGDIPSRSEYGMSTEDFNRAMPEEFWREVVDRVAKEVPDTLLLAEAFWLMEGYFVRTLGMHRVYNSAFMHMLRNEENEKYRNLIMTTLEFDPQILKRYVNFMNNPDEKTAVDQFGKGDKYFGICTMLSTMPGLPMFGHGQVEGYAEKYGMEYYRPYWDETPDQYLIERHEREIFPLIKRRYLFADVSNFLLYEFYTSNGTVDQNVFVYTNKVGNDRALVIFNNRYNNISGYIKTSTPKKLGNSESELHQSDIFTGLDLHSNENEYVIYKDIRSELEYIRSSNEIKNNGLSFNLEAYDYHVFIDFYEVQDDDSKQYSRIEQYLSGRGVPSIQEALEELTLAPVLLPIRSLLNTQNLSDLLTYIYQQGDTVKNEDLLIPIHQKFNEMFSGLSAHTQANYDSVVLSNRLNKGLLQLKHLINNGHKSPDGLYKKFTFAEKLLKNAISKEKYATHTLLIWMLLRNLGGSQASSNAAERSRSLIDEWKLGNIIEQTLYTTGIPGDVTIRKIQIIKIITSFQYWGKSVTTETPYSLINKWLSDPQIRSFIGINRINDILWFNKESFDKLLFYLHTIAWLESSASEETDISSHVQNMIIINEFMAKIKKAEEKSEYQISKLLEFLK